MSQQPKFQFRGTFLPAEIIHRLVEGKISKAKLLILIVVESLVECRGKGCWADNHYFANSLGLAANYVSNCIHEMIADGLLKISYRDGKRNLETAWSRTEGEDERTEKSVGNCTEEHQKRTEKSVRSVQKNLYHNNKDKIKRESGTSPPKAGEVSESGLFDTQASLDRSVGLPFAKDLYNLLIGHRKIVARQYNEIGWSNRFTQAVRELGRDDVTLALEKYRLHFGKKYMPSFYAATTFCENIPRILDIVTRLEEKLEAPPRSRSGWDYGKPVC